MTVVQLRELALKEVALRVEKKVETSVSAGDKLLRHDRLLAVIDSSEKAARRPISMPVSSSFTFRATRRATTVSRWPTNAI